MRNRKILPEYSSKTYSIYDRMCRLKMKQIKPFKSFNTLVEIKNSRFLKISLNKQFS
jgi:hypothetical protein